MLDGRQRRCPGTAVVPGDQHDVGMGLGDAGRHRADAQLRHQLHVDARPGIGVLEVVDELRQVLDRVDVVVRRRRDEPDARRRVAHLGDPRPDLVSGELAPLARLGALGHLDLDVVGLDEVLAGNAEAPGGRLLDGAAPGVAVGVEHIPAGILSALSGVRLPAEAVHGDRQGLVRLGGDRAVGHRPGCESLHDLADRLDLAQWHGLAALSAQAEQTAQGPEVLGLLVDGSGVLPEDVEAACLGGVLQFENRLGVEQVELTLAAPLVLAAEFQVAVCPLDIVRGVRKPVAQLHLPGEV